VPNAGQPYTLTLSFYDESSGSLADPSSVQLDITYGEEIGFVPDIAGPFTYQGASSPTVGQIWRTGAGQYAFTWQIPASAAQGVYVANWTCLYSGSTFLGTENFPVMGGFPPPVPAGDVGYWTGSIAYTPSAGTPASPATISFGAVDGNGICWLWQKIDGWDTTDVQGAGVIPRSGDHGGWPSPAYYAPRTMTWTVTASAPTQALRDLARSILQAAVPVSDLAVLTYDEPVPKQALVRRSGKIPETYPTLADVTFSVLLVAPDPRKYGTQLKSDVAYTLNNSGIGFTLPLALPLALPAQPVGGTLQLLNAGNFETRPVVTISGPITAPALVNQTTGQTVSWSGLTVPAGSTLTVDFNVRQATLGGAGATAAYRPADAFSVWWTMPPGMSTIQLTGSADTGASMVCQWRDSYM
jgi:hypothetical protein